MLPGRIFVRMLVLFRLIRASIVCTFVNTLFLYENSESNLLTTLL